MSRTHKARLARSGVYYYFKHELPTLEGITDIPPEFQRYSVFGVYRPAQVLEAAKEQFDGVPVRVHHEKIYSALDPAIIGHVENPHTVFDGKGEVCIDADVVLMQEDDMPTFKELSPGYTSHNVWQKGVTPAGEPYQLVCTNIKKINHLAFVPEARGGRDCLVMDGGMNMAKIHSGLLCWVKSKLRGQADGAEDPFIKILDRLHKDVMEAKEDALEQTSRELVACLADLPDNEAKAKLIRYLLDIPLMCGEPEDVVDCALHCVRETYEALTMDAIGDVMEKTMDDPKKQQGDGVTNSPDPATAAQGNKPAETPQQADSLPATSAPQPAPMDINAVNTAVVPQVPPAPVSTTDQLLAALIAKVDQLSQVLAAQVQPAPATAPAPVADANPAADASPPADNTPPADLPAEKKGDNPIADDKDKTQSDGKPESLSLYSQTLGVQNAVTTLDDAFAKMKNRR